MEKNITAENWATLVELLKAEDEGFLQFPTPCSIWDDEGNGWADFNSDTNMVTFEYPEIWTEYLSQDLKKASLFS